MNQTYPQGGLAALLASKGRKGDSVLVHMTPGEVEGLQALALATGGSLTTNPDTGLPQANWLKSILPAIAGSALKTFFPKMGSATTGLIVGGITGLVDKSFDKGLRSGLSAYSGAKTIEGLEAARKAVQPGAAVPKIISGEEEVSSARLRDTRTPIDLSKIKVEATPVQTVTKAPSLFGDGVRALFKPEGQEAFLEAVEGPYKRQGLRDLSRSAYFAGLANLLAQEPKKIQPGSTGSNARFYVPGEVNPLYGQGYDQWYFKPGYFSDKYPGYAEGGEVDANKFGPIKEYYESLLTPPGPPRDISDLNAYLDDLRNRLKKPYQPVAGSDWQYGQLPTGGTGGSGPASGGTVTPPGNDPFATGVTGTPTDFIKPPPPAPPAPIEEELTPPTNIARPATPGDLGIIVGTPPEFNVADEEPVIAVEPEDTSSVGVEVVEDGVVREIPVSAGGTGIDQFIGAALPPPPPPPPPPPEDTSGVVVETVDDSGRPVVIPVSAGGMGAGLVGAGGLKPITSGPIYSVGVEPESEETASEEFRQQLYKDLGGTGAVPSVGFDLPIDRFTPSMSTPDIGNLSKPVVDQILRDFDAQQAGQPQEKGLFTKFLDLLEKTGGVTGAAVSTFREAIEQYQKGDLDAKKLLEEAAKGAFGEELVEEAKNALAPKDETKETAKDAVEKELTQPEQPQTKAPAGGGSAIPWTSGQNYTLRDLKNPVESEEGYERDYVVSVPEAGDFAGGGRVRHFAQGGLGSLQQYAVGGKLLNGAGDGMSDDIKANINGTQEARLADGEFVIPADVVSHLGNGSTDAGAKQLYAMMDRIRKARTGRTKQAPEVKARKYMPA